MNVSLCTKIKNLNHYNQSQTLYIIVQINISILGISVKFYFTFLYDYFYFRSCKLFSLLNKYLISILFDKHFDISSLHNMYTLNDSPHKFFILFCIIINMSSYI